MSRYLYSWALSASLPFVFIRLLWLSRRQKGYRENILERFGFYKKNSTFTTDIATIWLHAVSVGETYAAAPLLQLLADSYPHHQFVLTHTTPSGRATLRKEFEVLLESRLTRVYLPYDKISFIRRFLRFFQPQIAIFVETEIWPNLLFSCARENIPSTLINARLSERSHQKAIRFQSLMRDAVAHLSLICAQNSSDAKRFTYWTAQKIHVTGNLKFDYLPAKKNHVLGASWRALSPHKKIICMASSRISEEEMLLEALKNEPLSADFLVVIVPRHPVRFEEVFKLCQMSPHSTIRRSDELDENKLRHAKIVIGDSMGEMAAYLEWADIAIIGGSFAPLGGQNLIEAFAQKTPVIVGPHTFNFESVTDDAINDGIATRVPDLNTAIKYADIFLRTPNKVLEINFLASQFMAKHQGASARTLSYLSTLIDTTAQRSPNKRVNQSDNSVKNSA